jgi:bacterioferritin (cytochrome b1)
MMSTSDELLKETLKKQIEVEKRTLNKLADAENMVSETAVRLVFMELRLDSWKHQKFLEAILDILHETPCDEWSAKVQRYVDRVKLRKTLEVLISEETEMLSLAEQSNRASNDPVAQFLLEHLIADEKSHRKELEELISLIQLSPLQSKKGQKGTDIACETDK